MSPCCHNFRNLLMRNWDKKSAIPAEIGSAILTSFLDDNSFSPFDPNEPSREHYQSQELFQTISFDVWRSTAIHLKENAKLINTKEPYYNIQSKFVNRNRAPQNPNNTSLTGSSPKKKSGTAMPRSKPSHKKGAAQKNPSKHNQLGCTIGGIDDIFWVQYPKREIFMRIDIDGDILDSNAHRIEFSDCGTIITYSSRIPAMMLDASEMLSECSDNDAFKYLLEAEIDKRKKSLLKHDANEHPIFQVRKSAKLPYPVKKMFHDRNYKELKTYVVEGNCKGALYTCFWLLPLDI